jgi:hypothetical protein
MSSHTSSRTTRSRSRGPTAAANGNGHADVTVPAAAAAPPSRAASKGVRSTFHVDVGGAAAAASSASANGNGHVDRLEPLPAVEPEVHDATGRSLRTNYAERTISPSGRYYWTQGEPDLHKVAAHMDTLTASDLTMRAMTTSTRESVLQLQNSVAALTDMSARLKRELREQKLTSNRRWFWAGIALVAWTLGQSALRQGVETVAWATSSPHEFFPALLDGIQVMSTWMYIVAFPLVLLLFIHKVLNGYGAGQFTLLRTIVSLVVGVGLQVPLLYFLCTIGLVFFRQLRETPLFDSQPANHSVTICVWLGTMLLDYVLIVLHHYME